MYLRSDIILLLTGLEQPWAEAGLQMALVQNLHPVPLAMDGAGKDAKRVHDCTPVGNSARNGKLGSLHLHHHLLFFHLDGAVLAFKSQRGHRKSNIFLVTQAGAALGKSEFQIPGELGRGLPELDAFRVRKPRSRIFIILDVSVCSLLQFFGSGPDLSILAHSLCESLWVNPRLNEIKRSLSMKAVHQDLSINFQYKPSG